MKEATSEVSMTVITIVLLAALLALGTWLLNGPAKEWISGFFNTDDVPDIGNAIE